MCYARIILMATAMCASASASSVERTNGYSAHMRAAKLAAQVKTYKVTLSKNSESTNREVFIQARDSSEARKTAKAQNVGWEVLLVTEVKE